MLDLRKSLSEEVISTSIVASCCESRIPPMCGACQQHPGFSFTWACRWRIFISVPELDSGGPRFLASPYLDPGESTCNSSSHHFSSVPPGLSVSRILKSSQRSCRTNSTEPTKTFGLACSLCTSLSLASLHPQQGANLSLTAWMHLFQRS